MCTRDDQDNISVAYNWKLLLGTQYKLCCSCTKKILNTLYILYTAVYLFINCNTSFEKATSWVLADLFLGSFLRPQPALNNLPIYIVLTWLACLTLARLACHNIRLQVELESSDRTRPSPCSVTLLGWLHFSGFSGQTIVDDLLSFTLCLKGLIHYY